MRIAQGAEAILEKEGNTVIKKRIAKSYRLTQIDESLRKFRTKREAKILCKVAIPAPKLLKQTSFDIEMEFIDGKKLSDVLDKDYTLAKQIGELTAKLHNQDIIHGDLTTSNMLLQGKTIFFIDFGLSFFSSKIEDKAVDIHLFKQALESRHHKVYEKALKEFFAGYQLANQHKEIITRFEKVEQRGRYKEKY
ncbi:Kae1-associated kinase Bud32 [Candidatus Woesearchaeota archaeon]|nr:MAG: Kae1-associated kinase Bud32 [Candidatus Woesearchaeota archaeon]